VRIFGGSELEEEAELVTAAESSVDVEAADLELGG
jgi:hypothetical protein